MAKKIEFPRHLYKGGTGEIDWNYGKSYSKEYVTNKKEYDAAIKRGFIDDFEEALYGPEEDDDLDADYEEVVDEKPPVKEVKPSPVTDDDF